MKLSPLWLLGHGGTPHCFIACAHFSPPLCPTPIGMALGASLESSVSGYAGCTGLWACGCGGGGSVHMCIMWHLSYYHFTKTIFNCLDKNIQFKPTEVGKKVVTEVGLKHLPLYFHSVFLSRAPWPSLKSNEGQNIRNIIIFNICANFWGNFLSSISFFYIFHFFLWVIFLHLSCFT